MKIYLAHNFAARDVLIPTIVLLERIGHEVTSTWITDDSHIDRFNKEKSALVDLIDIDRADAIVLYTDQYADRPGKGKFFELGYALAKGKQCYIIGRDDSCVFYALPSVTRIQDFTELPLHL